jgi:hypothetical protein
MKAVYKRRLLKLAAHLRGKNRGLKKFDFSCIISECGTAGCAIGEMPFVFRRQGFTQKSASITQAASFFDLDYPATAELFLAKGVSQYGVLPLTATAKQVARNIEAFVKRKEAQCS